MAKRIKFDDLLPLYRSVVRIEGSKFSLKVSNEEIRDALILAVDESNVDESGVAVIKGDYANVNLGQDFIISLSPPRVGMGILADDFSGYLRARGAKIKERNYYYLLDSGFYSGDETVPVLVSKYRDLMRLINLLSDSAHYLDTTKEEFVFYKDGRFIIPVVYSVDDVGSFKLQSFERLDRLMADPLHHSQKVRIFGESLVAMLDGIDLRNRFKFILDNLDGLYSRVLIGYNIFAADFTYEKAVAEIHSFKVDVITRVHKAITDIQGQILGIPVATFVALSQVKKTVSLNSQFAANTIIFFGVFVFCALLLGFLLNQRSTLDTISDEVKRQRGVFESKFSDKPGVYSSEFRRIDARICIQYAVLVGVFILDVLMFIGAVVYYIVHTRPIYDIFF
ncbi:TPA: hypothetical protein ACRNDU_000666 [Pseudomonas aeruginosa]|uniref:hypothetical protein n=1 Tax=Pseudomonas aeruginosa TaxID=287 RepID=UPI0003B97D2C|nr:hypothetical protein [Pseudomonas aeruginosa]EIU7141686.1 hypothetical protein [Pseudomonas aeruginosa]EIY2512034.1 hypothetical protein [Pseudomonas aeruginosa]EIY2817590.1 hypothetical protein [Pseudomonas aeruginosa]EKB9383712.1 hypothetical protein [Pseudomonas aeruginosa]EKU2957898.1 hypothetical protein [Pseudomonas aeruginosa]